MRVPNYDVQMDEMYHPVLVEKGNIVCDGRRNYSSAQLIVEFLEQTVSEDR